MSGAHAADQPPRRRLDRQGLIKVAVVALVVLIAVVALVLRVTRGDGDDGGASDSTTNASGSLDVPATPADLPEVGAYVESTVDASGDVTVRAWIRSEVAVQRLDAVTADPDSLPGTVEARGVQVTTLNGTRLASRRAVGTKTQRLKLRQPVTELYLTYTIVGDTLSDETSTVAGRGLARVTAMDVTFDGEAGPTVRLLRGPGTVLNAACLAADASFEQAPRGCGEPADDGAWQVVLRGLARHDRVLAQLED